TRQPLGPPGPRCDREANLGQPELCPFGCDPDVARERELEAAAEGIALDGGDRRHRQFGEGTPCPLFERVPLMTGRSSLRLELADMRPCRKGSLTSTTHDDCPHVSWLRGGQRREGGSQLAEDALRDGGER